MERFTYHRKGARLRTQVTTLIAMLGAEVVAYAICGPFLPRPWNWILVGLVPLGLVGMWLVTREYRLDHQVTPEVLIIRTVRATIAIDRRLIRAVTPLQSKVPQAEIGP